MFLNEERGNYNSKMESMLADIEENPLSVLYIAQYTTRGRVGHAVYADTFFEFSGIQEDIIKRCEREGDLVSGKIEMFQMPLKKRGQLKMGSIIGRRWVPVAEGG